MDRGKLRRTGGTAVAVSAICFAAVLIPTIPTERLSADEKIKRADGTWWSLQPLSRAIVPDDPTAATPIDAYVNRALKHAGLTPNPPADKGVLIRRLRFDLTGLPPKPHEIDAFLNDSSPDAYERLVDRLLASPEYGERWGRHWLDIVRFAESQGFEYDRLRDNAWPYRDYVIRSLNADKPYAQFVREQLAGDTTAVDDGVVATGFLVAGPLDQAGKGSRSAAVRFGAREAEMEDILGAVGQTFLGVTVNCARCHDHKLDPYSIEDYYRMKAVFDGVNGGDRDPLSGPERKRRDRVNAEIAREIDRLLSELSEIDRTIVDRIRKRRKESPDTKVGLPPRGLIARWTFEYDARDSVGGLHLTLRGSAVVRDGRLQLNGIDAFAESAPVDRVLRDKSLEVWLRPTTLNQGGGGAIGVQTPDGRTFDSLVYAERQPKRWMAGSDSFRRTQPFEGTDESAGKDEMIHLVLTYESDGAIRLFRNGRAYGKPYRVDQSPMRFEALKWTAILGSRHTGGGRAFFAGQIDEGRLYDRALSAEEVRDSFQAGLQLVSEETRSNAATPEERTRRADLTAKIRAAEQRRAGSTARTVPTYAAVTNQPEPTVVYKRGDVEKPGSVVPPSTPAIVRGPERVELAGNTPEADRRRRFADWVVDPAHPQTWRVIANRLWQHHFGDGIVRTPNDFGLGGELPSHPELLDWLADQMRQPGAGLKEMHRTIVLSDAYRRSSTPNPKASSRDAENRLLWRFAPRRLEAEAVRDAMAFVSGKLYQSGGGPSFRPFRIENFNSNFYVPVDDDRPDFNRRSVYRMNVNSAKDAVLDVLDCPDPNVKTPRRTTTTTPLQALTLMNGPFANRSASAMADRIQRIAGDQPAEQVRLAYRLAFGREPNDGESNRAIAIVREAGLTPLCWSILNANEFVFVR